MDSRLVKAPREEFDRVPGIDNQGVVDVLNPFPLSFLCKDLERRNRLAIQNGNTSSIYEAYSDLVNTNDFWSNAEKSIPVCPFSQTFFVLSSSSSDRG